MSAYDYTTEDYPEEGCPTYNQCIEDVGFDPKIEALGRAPTFFETIQEMINARD